MLILVALHLVSVILGQEQVNDYYLPISVLTGSEHKKSHTAFPMEMQLVHYKVINSIKTFLKFSQDGFSNMETALKEDEFDSLAILSVLYSVQLRSLASKRFLPNSKEIQHV